MVLVLLMIFVSEEDDRMGYGSMIAQSLGSAASNALSFASGNEAQRALGRTSVRPPKKFVPLQRRFPTKQRLFELAARRHRLNVRATLGVWHDLCSTTFTRERKS